MYLYNTTYHIDFSVEKQWMTFLTAYAIPVIKNGNGLRNIRLLKLNSYSDTDSNTFALQVEAQQKEQGKALLEEIQNIHSEMRRIFGENVLFFSTELEVIADF